MLPGRGVASLVIDIALAVAVAVAVAIAISVAYEPGSRPPDLLAYTLGATIGALVLARRRWPVGVLLASHVTLQAYYVANYPGIWPAVALSVAMYTVAASGHLRWAVGIAVWCLAAPLILAAIGV